MKKLIKTKNLASKVKHVVSKVKHTVGKIKHAVNHRTQRLGASADIMKHKKFAQLGYVSVND